MDNGSDDARREFETFWEDAAQVEQFAARALDHRLAHLMERCSAPHEVKVLDLGCAAGRNAEPLARAGFDLIAVDASEAMVVRTRERVASVLGAREAERRVLRARMDHLEFASEGSFDWVVALGVFQMAQTEPEWTAALREVARVTARDGLCLVATFGPGFGSISDPPHLVAGTRFLYEGFRAGRACLLSAETLDLEFARVGFRPDVPSETVTREADGHRRVTINALYRRD